MSRFLNVRRCLVVVFVAGVIACCSPSPGRSLQFALADIGGGSGGDSGSAIWARTWWNGSPQGPGPYVGTPSGGEAICIWHDLGPTLEDLNGGLSEASLPLTFWQPIDSGGHPGIWGVDEWAIARLRTRTAADHFDLVACPNEDQVPQTSELVESDIPRAYPPNSGPVYVWLYWDTVENPPPGGLPGLVGEAFDEAHLPAPTIGTSPSEVGGLADTTVVNLQTWLWIDPWVWRTYRAEAAGGGLVATVWAVPQVVVWRADWDYPSPRDDPQGGTTFGSEDLGLICDGPGAIYNPQGGPYQLTDCSFDFTQSSFGNYPTLHASIVWSVHWALSNYAGVVGGEGLLRPAVTTGGRPLRVLQVESVIASG